MTLTASDVVEQTRRAGGRPPEAARPSDNPADLESVSQSMRSLRIHRATTDRRYQAGGGVAERAKRMEAQQNREAARELAVDEFKATGRLPNGEQDRADVLEWFFGLDGRKATSHANARLREIPTKAARDRAADLIGRTELHPAIPEPPQRLSPEEEERQRKVAKAEVEDQKAVAALAKEARARLHKEDAPLADRHTSAVGKIVETLIREPERADLYWVGLQHEIPTPIVLEAFDQAERLLAVEQRMPAILASFGRAAFAIADREASS